LDLQYIGNSIFYPSKNGLAAGFLCLSSFLASLSLSAGLSFF